VDEYLKNVTAMNLAKIKEFIKIDGEIIKTFYVLFAGWECDDVAWLFKDIQGRLYCIGTNHGLPCFLGRSFLQVKIDEYKKALEETQEVLNLIKLQEGNLF
jgi:hypothetical protein